MSNNPLSWIDPLGLCKVRQGWNAFKREAGIFLNWSYDFFVQPFIDLAYTTAYLFNTYVFFPALDLISAPFRGLEWLIDNATNTTWEERMLITRSFPIPFELDDAFVGGLGVLARFNKLRKLSRTAPRNIPGRVQSRINIAKGQTRFTPLRKSGEPVSAGWEHVVQGHFNRPVTRSRSVFSITQDELKTILQSKQVINSPVTSISGGQYVRTVDIGRTIGTSSLNRGGAATRTIKVFTDQAGNLITAYPY